MNMPVIVAARLGFGRDMWGIEPHNITESLKWLYVAYFMYQLAECLVQLSILAFYLRIMVEPKLRLIVWIFIGLVSCFGIGNIFSMIFQCTPIRFFWDGWKGEMDGFCGVDVRLFGFIRGAIEIFLDLAILSMPLPMLYKLNMSRKKKLQIMSMFCVGFVITVVSCLRLWSFVQFSQTQNPTCKQFTLLRLPFIANIHSRRQHIWPLLVRHRIQPLHCRRLHARHARPVPQVPAPLPRKQLIWQQRRRRQQRVIHATSLQQEAELSPVRLDQEVNGREHLSHRTVKFGCRVGDPVAKDMKRHNTSCGRILCKLA
jgi:hypothetical protein